MSNKTYPKGYKFRVPTLEQLQNHTDTKYNNERDWWTIDIPVICGLLTKPNLDFAGQILTVKSSEPVCGHYHRVEETSLDNFPVNFCDLIAGPVEQDVKWYGGDNIIELTLGPIGPFKLKNGMQIKLPTLDQLKAHGWEKSEYGDYRKYDNNGEFVKDSRLTELISFCLGKTVTIDDSEANKASYLLVTLNDYMWAMPREVLKLGLLLNGEQSLQTFVTQPQPSIELKEGMEFVSPEGERVYIQDIIHETSDCEHEPGQTPLGGFIICKHCGENLEEI